MCSRADVVLLVYTCRINDTRYRAISCFISCRAPRQVQLAESVARAEAKVAGGSKVQALEELCLAKSEMRRFETCNAQLVWPMTVLMVGWRLSFY